MMNKNKTSDGFLSFGLSDIGLMRSNNEDVWIALPEHGFFAIADGMGGHRSGEIAAAMAIESLATSISSLKTYDYLELILELKYGIQKANKTVYEKGKKEEEHLGMGTTLSCLVWVNDIVIYAHIGDSRVYRLRHQKLELLTEDHSLFAKWLSLGDAAQKSKTPYPYKNVITRAIGTGEKAHPEIAFSKTLPGDLYFLCTDGLTDVLSSKDIEKILQKAPSLEKASQLLIEEAKIKGSSDNMTVLMVEKPVK